jgi:hypothetical protein
MSYVQKTIDELRTIDWNQVPQKAMPEDLEHALAYLRTFAKFIAEIHADSSSTVTAFASPIQLLGLSEDQLNAATMDECELIANRSSNAYEGIYMRHALEWAALCDSSHVATHGREHLFEPLIKLVAKRIPAIVRQGYWVVDENLFPLDDWVKRYTTMH